MNKEDNLSSKDFIFEL